MHKELINKSLSSIGVFTYKDVEEITSTLKGGESKC